MCDTEFTIEQGKLWMLQTRVGKRTGAAALKMAVDMVRPSDLGISKAEAVSRITEDHLDSVLHPQFASSGYATWAKGLGASPGAAVGRIYFTADDAAAAAERGETVVLVRNETSPEDVHGMLASEGILTARGGLVSHAAVVARGWGKPAVVGRRGPAPRRPPGDGRRRHALRGRLGLPRRGSGHRRGRARCRSRRPSRPPPSTPCSRGPTTSARATWPCGPTPTPVTTPPTRRTLGAEGIGLCRTEHMFLGEDRLPVVRRMILADTPAEEADALEELRVVQREDFIAILAAMDGLPVTVRLLDPPLHEFLPSTEELAHKEATVGLNPEERRLYEAALSWQEANPMLGTRGVRLGVIKPGLYAMQVRALMEAARQRVADGGHPIVEIMIPLTVTRAELALARGWVEDAVAEVNKEPAPRPSKGAPRPARPSGASSR